MIKYFFTLLLSAISLISIAQNIHVEYNFDISDISSIKEDLYITRGETISIQDSLVNFNKESAGNTVMLNDALYKTQFRRELSSNIFFMYTTFNDSLYKVKDSIPKIVWKIDKKDTKIIANYLCYKATANFRGSDIVAYYTEKIPYSAGPYKFFGLPGLILEVKDTKSVYNAWQALKVNLNYKTPLSSKINNFSQSLILKEFIHILDADSEKYFLKMTKNLPTNAKAIKTKIPRYGIEKKYEWE